MIEVNNLSYSYPSHNGAALRGVGFRASKGEVAAVLGPNGSGKTTLFQCLLGIRKPREGEVRIAGKPIGGMSRPEIARTIAVVPQDHEPPFPYEVLDVVLMGRAPHLGLFSVPSGNDREIARRALEAVGIERLADRPYTRISGGERQMVLIARCLAQQSPVMLLDEPTAHLDFRNQVEVLSRVRAIVKENGLVALLNLHDPNMALLFSDRVLLLKEGCPIGQGSTEEVVTPENLEALYGLEVEFISGNRAKVVCPKLPLSKARRI